MNRRHRSGLGGEPIVYFAPFQPGVSQFETLRRLIKKLEFHKTIAQGHLTALKLHFGEEGNSTFLRPQFAAEIVEEIKLCGGKPFLTDTSTLYTGERRNAVDHLNLARRHGFGPDVTGAPILMADGLKSNDWRTVPINGTLFDSVKIAGGILDADSLVVLSHFKGHVSAGFGGAIKNLAMGCAPAAGKKDQHAARLVVDQDDCVGCARCARNCPADAIEMTMNENHQGKAHIDKEDCIGCSECMTHCPVTAISMDWGRGMSKDFGGRMAEYAFGAVKDKIRPIYINGMMNITPLCDCVGWSDAPIAPDIGFAGSLDPVALDWFCQGKITETVKEHKTCNCDDLFLHHHPRTNPMSQLIHAIELGMGHNHWQLVTLNGDEVV